MRQVAELGSIKNEEEFFPLVFSVKVNRIDYETGVSDLESRVMLTSVMRVRACSRLFEGQIEFVGTFSIFVAFCYREDIFGKSEGALSWFMR